MSSVGANGSPTLMTKLMDDGDDDDANDADNEGDDNDGHDDYE